MKLRKLSGVALAAAVAWLTGCAHAPADRPSDPLEPVNRVTFQFNRTVDRYVIRPVAEGYVRITPNFVNTGVTNFFDNLFYPITIVNGFLQGKVQQGVSDTGRFLVNTTLGVAGVFDVASRFGLGQHDEDFGQTLGYWGVPTGWYLVLPFLGPSSGRDFAGSVADTPLSPLYYVDDDAVAWSLRGLFIIDTRARLLSTDRLIANALDPYLFVRDAYFQRREYLVYDGNPPQEQYLMPPLEEASGGGIE